MRDEPAIPQRGLSMSQQGALTRANWKTPKAATLAGIISGTEVL
jgi:hypothetical protein